MALSSAHWRSIFRASTKVMLAAGLVGTLAIACGRQEVSESVSAPLPNPPESGTSGDLAQTEFASPPSEGKYVWKREWNIFIAQAIEEFAPNLLDNAKVPQSDVSALCPGFFSANNRQKEAFWALFFAAFARYESGFNPGARMQEDASLNYNYSEGLLQLSYSDAQNYSNCKFNKNLGNITDPKTNLQCGVAIMSVQIKKRNEIFTDKYFYWSVLTNKKKQIRSDFLKSASQLTFCKAPQEIKSLLR